jgi:hypothetical protein
VFTVYCVLAVFGVLMWCKENSVLVLCICVYCILCTCSIWGTAVMLGELSVSFMYLCLLYTVYLQHLGYCCGSWLPTECRRTQGWNLPRSTIYWSDSTGWTAPRAAPPTCTNSWWDVSNVYQLMMRCKYCTTTVYQLMMIFNPLHGREIHTCVNKHATIMHFLFCFGDIYCKVYIFSFKKDWQLVEKFIVKVNFVTISSLNA